MMGKYSPALLCFFCLLAIVSSSPTPVVIAQDGATPTEDVPPTEPTNTPTDQPTPEESPTPEATETEEPTVTPEGTETAEATPTTEVSQTPDITPTSEATETAETTPTSTPTETQTPTPDLKCELSVRNIKLRIDGDYAKRVHEQHYFYPKAPITPYDTFNIIVNAVLKCVDKNQNNKPVQPDRGTLKGFAFLYAGASGSEEAEASLLHGPDSLSIETREWDSQTGTLPVYATYKVEAGENFPWILDKSRLEALIDRKEYFARVTFFYNSEEFATSSQTYNLGTCVHLHGADTAVLKFGFKRASLATNPSKLFSLTDSAIDALNSTYPFPVLRREFEPGAYIGSYMELGCPGTEDFSHSCPASLRLTTIVGEYPFIEANTCGITTIGGQTARVSYTGGGCRFEGVFLHEVGHALGRLDDAYIIAGAATTQLQRSKKSSLGPNCRETFTQYRPFCPECDDPQTRDTSIKGCGVSLLDFYQPGAQTLMEKSALFSEYSQAECMMVASALKGESAISIGADGREAWQKYGRYCGVTP
jgi:hypothetical protein